MKKAFIFDLDGVLVFTDQLHYQAWKKMADEMGIYFDEEINNRLRGVSRAESLEILLENSKIEWTDSEKENCMNEKNNVYRTLLEKMSPNDVSKEVKEVLMELRSRGHKLAIGSSSKNAKLILEKTELIQWFDAISDGTNITYSKPNPEVFQKAAEYLEYNPSDCIVVEDAYVGIDAAKAAQMMAVGIGDAGGYHKADKAIKNFKELLQLSNVYVEGGG